jgi:hypothetical protein
MYIEILNPQEMKVLLKFPIHKYPPANEQQLFFSTNLEYMIEILDKFRVSLFKKVQLEDANVKWDFVKIISRYSK